ncbi:MAG: 4-hydroxy-tetrahydrodipicolinate synthase [Methanobacteriaceae archaeon]|jgi:4-hydroxy-tetrahydrodipicolinate synthase|uniref:4-hydroxy-tetrahydrodipicolinate synthase n=1 Tax=Methanobrevibacter TaxID=2172 RepID=UPI002A15B501|nr:4-hydroxy-tetrahydrodipicolinate synthase [Methanobacteriaceae archaeon]MDD3408526.1 4-hydroxy-tetrahydrodipicolinate synthase [Methanobacteriaceae archaeon]MDD4594595.1 4-hydroxy-tetrahydrodipicolinate synthase [Methanobacteriaceae archaeon]
MKLEGTFVAMATPFTSDDQIDEEGYRANINFLIENGVNGLLAAGTSGESATITHEEQKKLIEILIDEAKGRVITIAGAGSNSTAESLDLVKFAGEAGADYALVITPYYNKPQMHGLIKHYETLNNNTKIPIIVYNVPSRTGTDLTSETIVELAKMDNIVGLKEAVSDLEKFTTTFKLLKDAGITDDDFSILSGEDGLTVPMMSLGVKGVISVVANIDPKRMSEMVNAALKGDFVKASELNYELYDLMKALFVESNPVPMKEALTMMGKPSGDLRLPLVPLLDEDREILRKALKDANLI